jgi:hypothetical protein
LNRHVLLGQHLRSRNLMTAAQEKEKEEREEEQEGLFKAKAVKEPSLRN